MILRFCRILQARTSKKVSAAVLACASLMCCLNLGASEPYGLNVDSLYSEASSKFSQGRQTDAMDDLFDILKMADNSSSGIPDNIEAKACLMLGNIYLGYNDHINASKSYERGFKNSSDQDMHLRFAYNLSISYCLMGNEEKSREYFELLRKTETEDKALRLYDLAVSGATIEKAFGSRSRSITLFKHALALVDTYAMPPEKYAIGPLSEIAEYYETQNRLDSAEIWLKDYERIALGSNYPHAVADSYRGLMRLYIKSGDREKALAYSSRYMSSMDSLVDFKRFITISSRRERERENETEAQIENLEIIISKQKATIYTIIALLLIAIAMWFVVSKYRGNMRQLFRRNKEIALLEAGMKSVETEKQSPESDKWHKLMTRIDAAMDNPENYLDPDFSINALASICESNTKYVSQAINETTGDNFRTLLNGKRIHEARRRLTSDPDFANLTIQSVGESVGFRSATNFINAFKKETGMTPSLYQKMMRE